MKFNRTYLFIGISSVALIIVLFIQVNWIIETAKIKEEVFNEKAKIVLAKTTEAIASDTVTYKNMALGVGKNEVRKIDSLFNHYMRLYNINIGYYFEVKPNTQAFKNKIQNLNTPYTQQPGCYQQCITDNKNESTNGMDLKLVIPDAEQFIREEMGIPFISSVILIIIVLVTFWRTTVSLMKEKEISEHTTDFLNNMTHEFKTPLTNIALAGKMITKESNIGEVDKIRQYSGIILEENEKLRLQVEQVLSMTALERGEIPLQKNQIDIHQIIHDAVKCMALQIENKHLNLKLNLSAENCLINGDKIHLANALCNLIDNGIKYGQEKPMLMVETSNQDEKLIVKITDNGIGIDKEYQAKVFDKYFRVPTGDVHNVKGFGIGLAYVKKIIELHEGTIEIESERNKGTIFTITIPNA